MTKKVTKEILIRALSATAIVLGTAILLNGIAVSFTSNFNLGIVITYMLGFILAAVGIFGKRLPKVLVYVFVSALALMIIFMSFLLLYGGIDNAEYDEDAIIVLGAGIHGEQVSQTLRRRLDSAVDYYEKNKDAVIVVSGGQGPGENITEALAMERYLIEQGIPQNKIIKEEKSTSTEENFSYSKKILDEYFDGDYSVAFATSEFHVYRSEQMARKIGVNVTSHVHGDTSWYMILPTCTRECLAVIKLWVLGR